MAEALVATAWAVPTSTLLVTGAALHVATSTRDVSMAIRSDSAMPVGTRAHMQVHANGHPSLALDVIVRRRIEEPAFTGLGVEFVGMTPDARAALMAVLRPVAMEDDAIFIDMDDPDLH